MDQERSRSTLAAKTDDASAPSGKNISDERSFPQEVSDERYDPKVVKGGYPPS